MLKFLYEKKTLSITELVAHKNCTECTICSQCEATKNYVLHRRQRCCLTQHTCTQKRSTSFPAYVLHLNVFTIDECRKISKITK